VRGTSGGGAEAEFIPIERATDAETISRDVEQPGAGDIGTTTSALEDEQMSRETSGADEVRSVTSIKPTADRSTGLYHQQHLAPRILC
jgi:hypothetical protein